MSGWTCSLEHFFFINDMLGLQHKLCLQRDSAIRFYQMMIWNIIIS